MMRMMNTPDEITGPINIGNPGEFTILQLAELVIELTASKSKIIVSRFRGRSETTQAGYFQGKRNPEVGTDNPPA